MYALSKFIEGMDWELLKSQKVHLLEVIQMDALSKEQADSLDGLLNMIDGLQDSVVEDGVATKHNVFITLHHCELEQIIHENLIAGGSCFYRIEQTANSPENFQLTIDLGEGEDEVLNYDIKGEAEQDIATASKIYGITFVNMD